ncbi:MAG: hypothetical protein Q7U04_04995 [Bacteriovorax sp.]|nr:hypothetical protein [Bacteriovorax sp.]
MKIFFFALILISTLFACSKKAEKVELKYSVEEIANLAHEASPSNEKGEDGLQFSDYAPGVNRLESKALMIKHLTFFAVSFQTTEEARSEAIRLNQYWARNWLFDRVEGEPILEDYVIETFKAINPKRKIQRIPKKHEATHEAVHEAAPAHH